MRLVGRSFKYHRPRGIFTAGAEEPNALVQSAARRARGAEHARDAGRAVSTGSPPRARTAGPSLDFDLGAIAGLFAPLLPAGFYYKTFMFILLERVAKLGQMGDVVRVKDGFARNFLLPRGKALRATAENRTRFETMKGELEARSLTLKTEAAQIAANLDGKSFTVLRQASEAGQLFGSVSPRDLIGLVGNAGFRVNRNQIALNTPIKTIGRHKVPITLHPEVETSITIIVARNDDEAARIARGEDVTHLREPTEAEAAIVAAELFFEPGAGATSPPDDSAEAAEKSAVAEER